MKKHNLFEETNLPSLSVSSLSDLKTPSGSAQASPARRPATSTTEVSEMDMQSSEVFIPQKITLEECHETRKTLNNEEGISAPVYSLPAEAKEEESISDLRSNQESHPEILKAVEEKIVQQHLDVEETSVGGNIRAENEMLVEEKKLPNPDSVNEIRNLLTVTVELPANAPPESKEQVTHDCEISRPHGCAGDRDKEDVRQAEECQMHEMPKSPEVHFPPRIEADVPMLGTNVSSISFSPSVEADSRNITSTSIPASAGDIMVSISFPQDTEADYINIPSISSSLSTEADYINVSSRSSIPNREADTITGISGEGKCISQAHSPEVSEEPGLCRVPKAELETVTSVWYTHVESSSPVHQSQAKQPAESEQSDQKEGSLSPSSVLLEGKLQVESHAESGQFDLREGGLSSVHFDPVDEKSQMEQDADNEGSEQGEEAVYFPHSVPEVDSSQMMTNVHSGKPDLQEAGFSSLHPAPTEANALSFSGSSLLETQELISTISNLAIEPADLLVSPEGKENEESSLKAPMNAISQCFVFAEQQDSKQAGVSLLSADAACLTEGETGSEENAEGDCPKSPSGK